MTLPPRGDPRRDLVRAADEARSLGMLMIGVGVLAGTCFLGNATAAPRGGSASAAQLLGFILFCGASGVFYVHASRDVRRGKGWAPTAILAVSARRRRRSSDSLHGTCCAGAAPPQRCSSRRRCCG